VQRNAIQRYACNALSSLTLRHVHAFTIFIDQIPTSTVVSMIVQSDKQLKYLATNESSNSLQVLLFDDITEASNTVSAEVPLEYRKRVLDYVLFNVMRTSTDLAWLKLPSGNVDLHDDTTLVTDSTVVHLQSLRSLRILEIIAWEELTELNISGLKKLQYLGLFDCDKVSKLVANGLAKLHYLTVGNCAELTTLQGLDELTELKSLYLIETEPATALAGLSELTELEHFIMNHCSGFSDLPQLRSLKNLTRVQVRFCDELTTLSALTSLVPLQQLDLGYCDGLTTLDVTGLTFLQYLNLSWCGSLSTLTGVDTLTSLQHLDLEGCIPLNSVLDLTGLLKLQLLDLGECGMLTDVQGISTLVALRAFNLELCKQLSTALDLTNLTSLTDVSLNGCTALPAVTGISKLAALTYLNLQHCDTLRITDDAVGTTMTELHKLVVSDGSILSYFKKQKLPALDELTVSDSGSIVTLDCSNWSLLTVLTVENCDNLSALQGLEQLSLLVKLRVFGCSQLEHIPALTCLKTLQSLSLEECPKLCSIYNSLTDFELLSYLDLSTSGIGKAIWNSTDSNLVEQVSALQQRPGFKYRDISACEYGYDYMCTDDDELDDFDNDWAAQSETPHEADATSRALRVPDAL
jgi:hypothetical protein